ncbi:hypothetical protein Q7C36_016238 [Tachysurus vachellii]|uniref:Uncharacterized protein n=1 Tax=Tachysurus vachellii TaxID=175792 RepID=A0AA88M974_TACVA|nr:hypothetical protein Q7C36_016238 [Tachysurus vachellii]
MTLTKPHSRIPRALASQSSGRKQKDSEWKVGNLWKNSRRGREEQQNYGRALGEPLAEELWRQKNSRRTPEDHQENSGRTTEGLKKNSRRTMGEL